jgi:hypothetical protein
MCIQFNHYLRNNTHWRLSASRKGGGAGSLPGHSWGGPIIVTYEEADVAVQIVVLRGVVLTGVVGKTRTAFGAGCISLAATIGEFSIFVTIGGGAGGVL